METPNHIEYDPDNSTDRSAVENCARAIWEIVGSTGRADQYISGPNWYYVWKLLPGLGVRQRAEELKDDPAFQELVLNRFRQIRSGINGYNR
jgi:hypothetical protein